MPFPKQEIVEELERTPIREVLGVVNAWGAFVSGAGQPPSYTARVIFSQWKLGRQGLITHRLTLHKRLAALEDAKPLRRLVQPYKVVRVRARVMDSSLSQISDGLLVDIVGEDESDQELVRIAQQSREPVVLDDSRFGALRVDRRRNSYEGSATWCSRPVQLSLEITEDENPEPALEAAHLLWDAEQEWNQRLCDYAALELFDLSQDWRQSEDEPITEESFRKRLKLSNVTMFPDGRFECWFDADEMFTDHAVRISGSLREGPTYATIEG